MHQVKTLQRVRRLNGFKWSQKSRRKASRKEGGHLSSSYSVRSNSESQDGVKEGNEGEDGMKNKKESQWRNAMKNKEMRKVKMPLRE